MTGWLWWAAGIEAAFIGTGIAMRFAAWPLADALVAGWTGFFAVSGVAFLLAESAAVKSAMAAVVILGGWACAAHEMTDRRTAIRIAVPPVRWVVPWRFIAVLALTFAALAAPLRVSPDGARLISIVALTVIVLAAISVSRLFQPIANGIGYFIQIYDTRAIDPDTRRLRLGALRDLSASSRLARAAVTVECLSGAALVATYAARFFGLVRTARVVPDTSSRAEARRGGLAVAGRDGVPARRCYRVLALFAQSRRAALGRRRCPFAHRSTVVGSGPS